MNDQTLGMTLLCAVCLVPLLAGLALGWLLKTRHAALGFPGMLLPRLLRDKFNG